MEMNTFSPVRMELVFEKNTYCKSEYSCGETLILFQIGLFCLVGETYVSLQRKPSM
jgi:hypothetical protein